MSKGKSKSEKSKSGGKGTTGSATNGRPGKQATAQSPAGASRSTTDPYNDVPFFLAVTVSPLVVGSIIVTGLTPGDMSVFSAAIFGSLFAHLAGKAFAELVQLRAIRIPGVVVSSVEDLKQSISKHSVAAEKQARRSKLILLLGLSVTLLIVFGIANFKRDISASLLFAAAYLLFFTRRADTPGSPKAVILHAVLTTFLMTVLGALGVFSQSGTVHLPTSVIGLVPGSILGAAVVAYHATVFPSDYWRRIQVVPGKDPKTTRPGKLTQLFTMLLISGPLVVFVLTPARVLPPPLMLGVLPVVWAPKLATAFTQHSLPDREIAMATAKTAALAALCMLVAGYLAAHS